MKQLLTTTVVASGLLIFSPASSAAYFDFQDWIDINGEQGFDNSAPFTMTDSSLTLTATAYESPGMVDSHVYMDDQFNGIIGGMGVCSVLNSGNQCTPSSDDNVSIDGANQETLSWSFDQSISQLTLELGDTDHYDFANSDFEYNAGSGWLTATTDADGIVTILTGGTGAINFRASAGSFADHFYIRNADITVVPVPAAVWLFGSGLLGLVGMARRMKV